MVSHKGRIWMPIKVKNVDVNVTDRRTRSVEELGSRCRVQIKLNPSKNGTKKILFTFSSVCRQLRKAEHALKQQTEGGHSFAVRTLWLAFTFPPLNVLGRRPHLWGMGWCWVKVKAGHILASGWEVRVRLSPGLKIESQSGRQTEKNVFVAPAGSHDRSGSQWRNVPCSPPDSLHCSSQVSYVSRGRETRPHSVHLISPNNSPLRVWPLPTRWNETSSCLLFVSVS